MSDSRLRICQFFNMRTVTSQTHRYQNYFIGEKITFKDRNYDFLPFRAEGAISSLNGDNPAVRVLCPADPVIIALVEAADGNRRSSLTLTTAWLDAKNAITTTVDDFLMGIGASFNDDTVELRFRSSMDSVSATFPARTLTQENVGILPITSELYLR